MLIIFSPKKPLSLGYSLMPKSCAFAFAVSLLDGLH